MRAIAGAVAVLLVAFAAITWWALEADGVATIETRRADGSIRTTHVWWIDDSSQLWLEAGSPSNGWFVDVGKNPLVTLKRGDAEQQFVALPADDEVNHEWIRAAIRRKYGFRDRWVNLVIDTSRSVAVRLMPPEKMISSE